MPIQMTLSTDNVFAKQIAASNLYHTPNLAKISPIRNGSSLTKHANTVGTPEFEWPTRVRLLSIIVKDSICLTLAPPSLLKEEGKKESEREKKWEKFRG
ncbi:hypothetical protein CDAR_179351 [Caerostris darwini]|uniref:Uncharacterized protein n=1 Tax=Caerostris darwini TaxID=1538125 RepID=A0AAV4PA64_9ARAC|nr:hypothetical protein CDAR_179351 [Caerostris darwini]